MTNTELEGRMVLPLLRALRDPQSPMYSSAASLIGFTGLVDELVERGLLIKPYGSPVTTSSQADRLLDLIDEMGAELLEDFTSCDFTLSHTSGWCGNPYCREN